MISKKHKIDAKELQRLDATTMQTLVDTEAPPTPLGVHTGTGTIFDIVS
jgi:hypothetical protein